MGDGFEFKEGEESVLELRVKSLRRLCNVCTNDLLHAVGVFGSRAVGLGIGIGSMGTPQHIHSERE